MTWREYQLRLLGFKRRNKDKWIHTREVAYMVYLNIPEKGKKVSKEQFMPLEDLRIRKSAGISERGKELYMKAINEAVNGGRIKD